MIFSKVRLACRKNGVKYDGKSYNCLRYHSKSETLPHFLAKARIFKHCMDLDLSVFSEFQVGQGVADLYILDLDFVVEIQGDMSEAAVKKKYEQFKGHELWVFSLKGFETQFEGYLQGCLERMGVLE